MTKSKSNKHKKPNPEACVKCGRCCLNAAMHPGIGMGVLIGGACQYMDQDTNLCLIFENRHILNPKCLTVDQAVKIHRLPQDCACVKGVRGYRSLMTPKINPK